MKKILIIAFLSFLFANDDLITLFKEKKYSQICLKRWSYINKYRFKDEKKLNLVAYSCLQIHDLIFALDLAKNMTLTKEGRNNAIYITSLFLMKKFLISYLKGDNIDFSSINLPTLKNHILSKMFNYVKTNKPPIKNFSSTFTIKDKKYKIYPFDHSTNLVIEIYDTNNNLIKKVRFW